MNNGWIKLHRKMFDNKLWLSEPFTKAQAWIDLFANANHEENSFWVRGIEVRIKRGQIGWSELTMCTRWCWSKNKVRRYLKWLETEQQIEQQKTYITSIITIKNYDEYQKTEQQTIQQKDSRRYTNKNDKNVKNDKKEEGEGTTPSQEASSFFKGEDPYKELLETFSKGRDAPLIENEFKKFILYWTEKNKSGTKERWQQQDTFEVKRRLLTWLSRVDKFTNTKKQTKIAFS